MEDRLKELIKGNSEENRIKWVTHYKEQGKKVIGIMSTYIPEEVIYAAGMLPWRITGTWKENIAHARVYRADSSCSYCNHVLESLLSGELDFLDGIVIADQDQDLLRFWDLLTYYKIKPFIHLIHPPFVDSELNYQYFRDEIRRLISSLQNYFGVTVTEESLRSSIDTYNHMRNLLSKTYELRKREIPPLSGAEILGITTAATVMPKSDFIRDLESLLPYMEERQTSLKQYQPRILLSSDMLDNPAYIELVEENCLVAMDDMDTGSRYFNQNIDNTLEDPAYAIAKRYLNRHGAAHMARWELQVEQIIKWVEEFNIDGVLSLPHTWCYPQKFRMAFLSKELEKAGIPNVSLDREYHLSNVGQLRTRIGAFLEMLI